MPEIAEVRITSDYVNHANSLTFYKIRKNLSHKGTLPNIQFTNFKLSSESRGKELMLYIKDVHSNEQSKLLMTMGMSGFFQLTRTGSEPKHAHLMFDSIQGWTLSFVDVRRFGKWKLAKGWSPNRGPDPIREFDKFKTNILNNLDNPIFQKPIYEVLMNQTYFNGIGNYIRSEVICRIPELNPLMPAKEALINYPSLYQLCRDIPSHIYTLNGGNILDWRSPFNYKENLIKFYQNRDVCFPIKDNNGRTFWCLKKWKAN